MWISLTKSGRKILWQKGVSLMRALLAEEIPVASSCHGEGVCGKCRLRVISGIDLLKNASTLEKELIQRNQLAPDERISCLARPKDFEIQGSVEVDASYW